MPTFAEICAYLDTMFPPSLAEPWDRDGPAVDPCPAREVTTAVVALDVTSPAIEYAAAIGAQCIVTHHPLLFKLPDALRADESVGGRVLALARAGIAAVSCHTRLDSASGGVNDCLAAAVGLQSAAPFLPFGRIGTLPAPLTAAAFRAQVEEALGAPAVVYGSRPVSRVAVVSGSGKDYVREAFLAGADTFLTGEVNHSAIVDAGEYGLNLAVSTHYATEAVVLPALAERLRAGFPALRVELFREDARFCGV